MARLVYSMIASLDGYVADEGGNFDWATPDEELHGFINDLERRIGTYLYGRRMYETMVFWETALDADGEPEVFREYARIWQAADKVVYSRTLSETTSKRTRVEREFDPGPIRDMKARAGKDISVSGPHLAGEALRARLVDEVQLFVAPVIVGGGNRAFPAGVHATLELLDSQRFASGFVYLRYRTIL